MSLLEILKQSDAWDLVYDLPTFPRFNNPWIYMAYADLRLRQNNESLNPLDVYSHFTKCEKAVSVRWREPGLFMRWPDGSGGMVSCDEVIGAAYLGLTKNILDRLDRTDGDFNNTGEASTPEQRNLYRFPWLRPFLAVCAGYRVSLISQAIWCIYLLDGLRNFDRTQVGPHLKRWLMAERMRTLPLCRLVIAFWAWKMNRSGLTLEVALKMEPGGVIANFEPERWTWPK